MGWLLVSGTSRALGRNGAHRRRAVWSIRGHVEPAVAVESGREHPDTRAKITLAGASWPELADTK